MGSEEPGGKAGSFIIGVKMDVIFDLPSRQQTSRHAFRVLIVTGFVQKVLISLKLIQNNRSLSLHWDIQPN